MLEILHIFATTVELMLSVTMLAMAARMILPLFVEPESSRIYVFSALISEPLVAPVRFLLSVFGVGDNMPIDIALPTAYFLLMIIRMFMPAL